MAAAGSPVPLRLGGIHALAELLSRGATSVAQQVERGVLFLCRPLPAPFSPRVPVVCRPVLAAAPGSNFLCGGRRSDETSPASWFPSDRTAKVGNAGGRTLHKKTGKQLKPTTIKRTLSWPEKTQRYSESIPPVKPQSVGLMH